MNRILTSLVLSAVLLSGCGIISVQNQTNQSVPLSGIFWTDTAGESWAFRSSLYSTTGQVPQIAYNHVLNVTYDPSDLNTVYLATDTGLYYTFNQGEGWFATLQNQGVVNDISVDPNDRCTIYAAVHNKIYKTTDCARSWNVVHFSSLAGEFFQTIMVSRANSSVIYVGSSKGALLESRDAGRSWQVKQFIDSQLVLLLENPYNVDIFYRVSPRFGIQRTADNGETWSNLNDLPVRKSNGEPLLVRDKQQTLRQLPAANTFYYMQFDRSQEEGLIYASGYGIFRLVNAEYWQVIDILNRPAEQKVYSIANDAETGQTIYFGAQGAIYRSVNGGEDWTVLQPPSNGFPKAMILAPDARDEFLVVYTAPPQ